MNIVYLTYLTTLLPLLLINDEGDTNEELIPLLWLAFLARLIDYIFYNILLYINTRVYEACLIYLFIKTLIYNKDDRRYELCSMLPFLFTKNTFYLVYFDTFAIVNYILYKIIENIGPLIISII